MYAMEVMAAGLLESEPEDIIDKISRDFTERGIHVTRGEILVEVTKKHELVEAMSQGARTATPNRIAAMP